MTTYDHFVSYLASIGLLVDTGFLLQDEQDEPHESLPKNFVGYRFESGPHQIDLYLRDKFFDVSKSHPTLGESQVFEGTAGQWRLTQILS